MLCRSVMSDSLWPYWLWPSRLLCPWGFSRQEYWSGLPCPPPGALPNPGIKPRSPKLQADSLLFDPPEKPKNTAVGSLFLIQGIFPTQESNHGLLHCRWILCQLNYQGSPTIEIVPFNKWSTYVITKNKKSRYHLSHCYSTGTVTLLGWG